MRAKQTDPAREAELAAQYQRLAKNLAAKLHAKCTLFDRDNLESAAQVGLLRAIRSYKPESGAMTTWITRCCQSEMLTAIRNMDHISRYSRIKSNDRDKAIAYLTQQLQKPPTDDDLEAAGVKTKKTPEVVELSKELQPRARTQRCTMAEADTFREATRGLTLLEQTAVYLRYYHDMPQKQVGEVLGIGESRMSQVMQEIKKKLRKQSIFDALTEKIAEV